MAEMNHEPHVHATATGHTLSGIAWMDVHVAGSGSGAGPAPPQPTPRYRRRCRGL